MLRPVAIYTSIPSYLLLAACFLVTDGEIARRVNAALPSGIEIQINEIEKSLSCIATKFTLLEHVNWADTLAKSTNSTETELGKVWHVSTTFSKYVEALEKGARRSSVEGTIVHSRPCMESIGFDTNQLYERPAIVTRSNSGKELMIVFDQSIPQFGIYLAQGR